MKPVPILDLLSDLGSNARAPAMLWQIGAIVLCIGLGWTLARVLRASFVSRDPPPLAGNFGIESFSRVLAPLMILLLLALSKYVLAKWQHVHLLGIALPIVGSLVVIRFGFYLLRRVFARRGHMLAFEKIFALLVWLAVVLYITGLWPDLLDYLDDTTLPLGRHKVSVATILQALVSVGVLLMLALWAGAALEERLMKIQGMHTSLRVVMARMGRAVLILVAVLVSLSLVGIDLTVLSVFGGALGVGLGLGLQKIASNYISGFIILFDRSLTIGDMITVDKFFGKVTHINTRYTVLQGLDGVEAILPNEMLVSGPVQNFSLSNKMLRVATQVTVAYDSDLDLVLSLLEQAATGILRVSTATPPMATLQRFGADGLELELGFWIEDPENGRGGVSSDVNRAVWRALQAHQISVPYPQREVRIIGALRLDGAAPALSGVAIPAQSG